MLRTTCARLRDSKGRLALAAATVLLGVMFLVAALVLSDSTRSAIHASYAQAYAGTDVLVRAAGGATVGPQQPLEPVSPSTVERVAAVPGVEAVEGRVRQRAQVMVPGGESSEAFAVAAPADLEGAAMQLRDGVWPSGPGEVAVDAAMASQLGVGVGEMAQLLLPSGVRDVTVTGTVRFGQLDGLAGGGRIVFDRDTAVQLLAPEGFGEIAVTAAPGTSPGELAVDLASLLGEDVSVTTAAAAADRDATTASQQAAVIGYVLAGVAVVGLLIGSFLIANTLRMLVAQRTRELALLRAVGATRRQVAGSVVLEAGITGLVGAVAGTALGVGVGALLTSTSGGLVPGLPPTAATVTVTPFLVGPLVGVAVAVLASRSAVRRALDLAPVAAMRRVAAPDRSPRPVRLRYGLPALGAGLALVVAGSGLGIMAVAAGGALAVTGAGALFPFVTAPALRLLSRPLEGSGATARLARQQTLAAPGRTGATAAAIAVSLALVTFLLTFSASLSAATPNVVAGRERADLTVRSDAAWGLHGFMTELARKVDQRAGVAIARDVAYGSFPIAIGDEPAREVAFYATDPGAVPALFHIVVEAGEFDRLAAGEVALRHERAAAYGLDVGDTVAAQLPDGSTVELAVGAMFSGPITTDWIVPPETASPYLDGAGHEVFIRLDEHADPAEVRSAVETVADEYPATQVLDRGEKEAAMAETNSSTLGILTALLAVAVFVGVLGVLNTLSLAVVERIREFGLLRAVGATSRQVRSVVRWEAALIAMLGAVLGTGIGVGLAWIATEAFTEFTVPFSLPILALALACGATIVLGTAAAILPARRAARIDLLRALHTT